MKTKISETRIKKKINQKIFEEFMNKYSNYFKSPVIRKREGDSKYVSKGETIIIYYKNGITKKYGNKVYPNFSISYQLKYELLVSTSFWGGTKKEIKKTSQRPGYLKLFSGRDMTKEKYIINDTDETLFKGLEKLSGLYNKYKNEKHLNRVINELINEDEEIIRKKELIKNEKIKKIQPKIKSELKHLDRDGNGIVDNIQENSFEDLLHKNQSQIISVNQDFIQKFVKISVLLNDKKENIQKCFMSIQKVESLKDLNNYVKIIKNLIHSYELLLFHSISMISSLTKKNPDLVTFYEIYNLFDRLGVFDSNHEKQLLNQLKDINSKTSTLISKIDGLMYQINSFENSMIENLSELNYTTRNGFESLQDSMSSELKSINSSININNLLTGIQTYQLYKIKKNQKE